MHLLLALSVLVDPRADSFGLPRLGRRIHHALAAKGQKSLDPELRNKLLVEQNAPFRVLRYLVFGGSGFSAAFGGLTACTQLAAAIGGAPDALPVQQCLQNVGIDFGVVAVCGYVVYKDFTGQQEDLEKMEACRRHGNTVRFGG